MKGSGTTETLSEALEEKDGYFKEPRNEEEISEKTQNNFSLVTSLAEKAMSVAAPVVPTKEDGEVDHERSDNQFFFVGLESANEVTIFHSRKVAYTFSSSIDLWHCWQNGDKRVAC